jgi:hypothetical protein
VGKILFLDFEFISENKYGNFVGNVYFVEKFIKIQCENFSRKISENIFDKYDEFEFDIGNFANSGFFCGDLKYQGFANLVRLNWNESND